MRVEVLLRCQLLLLVQILLVHLLHCRGDDVDGVLASCSRRVLHFLHAELPVALNLDVFDLLGSVATRLLEQGLQLRLRWPAVAALFTLCLLLHREQAALFAVFPWDSRRGGLLAAGDRGRY